MKKPHSSTFTFVTGFLAGFMGLLVPPSVSALPQGGQIVAGQGNIEQATASQMVVNQSSRRMVADWKGFSIGASETVQFIQPGADSVALNRVTGGDPSSILGRLSSNGQVFLSNPSGILFGSGARVNVGGLIATTLDLSNQDFLDGNYSFTQDSVKTLASIINEGNLNGDYIGLLAPAVQNRGSILATLGSVALASGTEATLDFIGDGLINFSITQPVEGIVLNHEGNIVQAGILDTGSIEAPNGQVILSVDYFGSVVRNAVNHSGNASAQTAVIRNGDVYLEGGDGEEPTGKHISGFSGDLSNLVEQGIKSSYILRSKKDHTLPEKEPPDDLIVVIKEPE